jgi:hypothetical protein
MNGETEEMKMKQCWIKVRYAIGTGTVCARIINEKNVEYTTCIHADGRATCTCEARRECYHIKHLRAEEAKRQPAAQPQQETDLKEDMYNGLIAAQERQQQEARAEDREKQAVRTADNVPPWMLRGRGGILAGANVDR